MTLTPKIILEGEDRASAAIDRVTRSTQRLTNQMGRSNGFFVRNRRVVQQAGFQVSDFAIQIAGGQSAMLAFTQQGGQMLQFFGAFGAAAAGVLAVGGSIAVMLLKSGKLAKSFKGELGDLNKTLAETERLSDLVVASTKRIAGAYGFATKEVRELIMFQRMVAGGKMARDVEQLFGQFVPSKSRSKRLLGPLTPETMRALTIAAKTLTETLSDGMSLSADDAERLGLAMRDLALAKESGNFRDQLNAIRGMRETVQSLNIDMAQVSSGGAAWLGQLTELETLLGRVDRQMIDISEQGKFQKVSAELITPAWQATSERADDVMNTLVRVVQLTTAAARASVEFNTGLESVQQSVAETARMRKIATQAHYVYATTMQQSLNALHEENRQILNETVATVKLALWPAWVGIKDQIKSLPGYLAQAASGAGTMLRRVVGALSAMRALRAANTDASPSDPIYGGSARGGSAYSNDGADITFLNEAVREYIANANEAVDATTRIGGAASKAADQVSTTIDTMSEFAKSVSSVIKNGIGNVFDAIWDKSRSVVDALRDIGKELLKVVAKAALFRFLGTAFPGTFGPTGFAPLVPATGSAFTAPIAANSTRAPLSAARAGGGGTVVQIVNNTGQPVSRNTQTLPNGRTMERFVVGAVGNAMTRGTLDSPMGARFGQKPSKVRR